MLAEPQGNFEAKFVRI